MPEPPPSTSAHSLRRRICYRISLCVCFAPPPQKVLGGGRGGGGGRDVRSRSSSSSSSLVLGVISSEHLQKKGGWRQWREKRSGFCAVGRRIRTSPPNLPPHRLHACVPFGLFWRSSRHELFFGALQIWEYARSSPSFSRPYHDDDLFSLLRPRNQASFLEVEEEKKPTDLPAPQKNHPIPSRLEGLTTDVPPLE